MHKNFLKLGALYGAIAVVLGAFAAHGLSKIVSENDLAVFKTGVQYQMYHSLALLAVAIVYGQLPTNWIKWSGYFFSFGIIFFSGSLYLITALQANEKNVPVLLGIITPIGGLFFICGWVCLLLGAATKNK
ncbi:MAG TPA: DUF423 domain-containing protein [Chitinophagaceae bacterium]|jgi:uncharacterized membrane protein YgdD (TMEM256/DUF423 family)